MTSPASGLAGLDDAARGLSMSPSQSSLLRAAAVADHQTITEDKRFTVRAQPRAPACVALHQGIGVVCLVMI